MQNQKLKINKRILSPREIKSLNSKYKSLTAKQRIKSLYEDFDVNEIMLTSSFATTSALLLKLISEINEFQKIYFIDTGFHFEETLNYKKTLTDLYGLNVSSISALLEEHNFTLNDETWNKNPDFCCFINKVKPLDIVKSHYTVWVSGLMEWQSDHRSSLDVFEMRNDILKFYPLLDVSKEGRDNFIREQKLPFHPLVSKGYHSVGCTHCTSPGKGRNGRWNNSPKTECGLHL